MKTLREYMEDNGFILKESDAKNICELVLTWELERIREEEPFAVNSIATLEKAIMAIPE